MLVVYTASCYSFARQFFLLNVGNMLREVTMWAISSIAHLTYWQLILLSRIDQCKQTKGTLMEGIQQFFIAFLQMSSNGMARMCLYWAIARQLLQNCQIKGVPHCEEWKAKALRGMMEKLERHHLQCYHDVAE